MKNFMEILVIMVLSIIIFIQYQNESKSLVPITISNVTNTEKDNPVSRKLNSIGVPSNPRLVSAICFASQQYNISEDLIISITWTESNFKERAVSCKGYNGLMQIPHKVFQEDANVLIGTKILREKMKIANGDMTKAILLYKGYPLDSARGHQQVKKVFSLYHKLKTIT